jgi:heptosyltransferase-2
VLQYRQAEDNEKNRFFMPEHPVKQILVVGPSWVGDMVMSQALFMALRESNPEVVIDVLAPAWSLPILERMPEVRKGIVMPVGHGQLGIRVRRELAKTLRGEQYEQAILIPNSLKSALVPFFARIPKRTGWRGEWRYGLLNDVRVLDKKRYPLMVERLVALAYPSRATLPAALPQPRLRVEEGNQAQLLAKLELNHERPALLLCPGAEFGEAKKWPEAHYAALAEKMIGNGWQVWLSGSANDRAVTDKICQLMSDAARAHCKNLAGETELADVVDLMAAADTVVSNDSGLMHIAAALDKPLVVVYGSTSPAFTPPLSDKAKIVSLELACSPCFKRQCPLGHLDCLKKLQPEKVASQVLDLVSGPGIGGGTS